MFEGGQDAKLRAGDAARIISAVIARLDRVSQYSEVPMMETISRGVLDTSPSPGMTGVAV
jgi:hypothetical protein